MSEKAGNDYPMPYTTPGAVPPAPPKPVPSPYNQNPSDGFTTSTPDRGI